MRRTTLALVAAVLATATVSLQAHTFAQQPPLREGEQPYHGYKAPPKPPVTVLNRAKISPEQFETYVRIRQDLMQNPNVAPLLRQPEELRAQALERYLQREGAGMSAEEFVRIHREVQNDPDLRAAAEGGAPQSGAPQSGSAGSSTGAAPSASPQ